MSGVMSGALSAFGPMLAAGALAQPTGKKRAAVVIGVDKAGELPLLRAAASGARQVETLLRKDGYDVKALVDDTAVVTVRSIFDAVDAFVQMGTYDQLVVYFAGHGFAAEYVEYWLLSDATRNPNEAVSLRESVALARLYTGIPNVIFISDACRSTPTSLGLTGIRGGVIFRTAGSVRTSDVDQFMATLVGEPSFEVAVADSARSYAGIYTTTLLSAFAQAHAEDLRKVAGVDVVPNKRLKRYLEREVPLRAQKVNIQLNQRPDAQVTSDDDVFIASASGVAPQGPGDATASVRQLAATSLDQVGLRGLVQRSQSIDGKLAAANRALDDATGFSRSQSAMANDFRAFEAFVRGPNRLRSAGFFVTGQAVKAAWAIVDGSAAEFVQIADGVVTLDLPRGKPVSALIQFADGTSTLLAALDRYVAHVVVARSGVINVSYVPRDGGYDRERLNALHAAVATAARFGVFRIERQEGKGRNAGKELADTVRMMKSVDPTLGLYAAYAYFDAGIFGDVESVRRYMRGFLQHDLFDTAMLSRAKATDEEPLRGVAPRCPMLAQGWALLRANKVRLSDELQACRKHLRPALWSTFEPAGTELLLSAMRQGRL
jgi:hypothetical protein